LPFCYPHRRMRAAAILGLGCSEKDLRPFQRGGSVDWQIGLPSGPADADAILVFGGDGTIHRHLAQLVRLKLPVLVVPHGSGNDFARALRLRSARVSLLAWRKFLSSRKTHTIDLGLITPASAEASHPHYFCTIGGVGLDSEVARRANQLPRWLRGHGGYAVSLPAALFNFAPLPMKIQRGGDSAPATLRPTVLAAFANATAYGGGMKIAPRARLDDGMLDLCVVTDVNKFKLFCLFPTVYFGRHLSIPEVEYSQVERIRIETETPLDVYADGEYVCRTPIEVSVARAALQVIVC